jgi:hypothetical protein
LKYTKWWVQLVKLAEDLPTPLQYGEDRSPRQAGNLVEDKHSRSGKEGLGKETDSIWIGVVRSMDHASFQIRKVTNDFIV